MTANTPYASVVVAAFSGEAPLGRCLESLLPQAAAAEVIVSLAVDDEAFQRLSRSYPSVRLLNAPPHTDTFQLRTLGLAAARGPLLALTEDHCTTAPGWLDALRAAHAAGHKVVGGVVENGHAPTAYGRALYWCEYAAQMPPLAEGPGTVFSGVNVAYDREALFACRETWRRQFCESEVHLALARQGHGLHRAPAAVVTSHLGFRFSEALAHLYRGGLGFGHERLMRSGPAQRWLWRCAVVAVPALLVARVIAAVVARRPRESAALFVALPCVTCLATAWGLGEAAGYWGSRA